MRLAYIVTQYPKVSHTFIRREIQELESKGHSVKRLSIRASNQELVELDDLEFEMTDDERGDDDPTVENGFFAQTNITTLPVWAEDKPSPPTDPDDPTEPEPPVVGSKLPTDVFIEYLRHQKELYETWLSKLQDGYKPDCDDDDCDDGGDGGTFGL